MKKQLALMALIVMAGSLLLAIPAFAGPHGHAAMRGRGVGPGSMGGCGMGQAFGMGPGMGPFWRNPTTVQILKLSDDQIKKLEELHKQFALNSIDLEANLKRAHLEYGTLMDQYRPDAAKLKKAVEAVNAAQGKMMQATSEFHLQIQGVLTEEQFGKLKDLPCKNMRGQRHEQRHHMWQNESNDQSTEPPADND